jgi:hypothetical protein
MPVALGSAGYPRLSGGALLVRLVDLLGGELHLRNFRFSTDKTETHSETIAASPHDCR